MTERRNDLFADLTPPSGGLARLRERLDAEGSKCTRFAWLVAPAVAAAAVGLWLSLPADRPALDAELDPVLVRYGATPPASIGARVAREHRHASALQQIPSPDEDILLYWVASTAESK